MFWTIFCALIAALIFWELLPYILIFLGIGTAAVIQGTRKYLGVLLILGLLYLSSLPVIQYPATAILIYFLIIYIKEMRKKNTEECQNKNC